MLFFIISGFLKHLYISNHSFHVTILSFPPFVTRHLVPRPSTHSQQTPLRHNDRNLPGTSGSSCKALRSFCPSLPPRPRLGTRWSCCKNVRFDHANVCTMRMDTGSCFQIFDKYKPAQIESCHGNPRSFNKLL